MSSCSTDFGPAVFASATGEPSLRVGKLQWLLYGALENARAIDNHSAECESYESLCTDHVDAVRTVVRDAIEALDVVIADYERDSEVAAADESGVFHSAFEQIVAEGSCGGSDQRIADVAFMARWELERKLELLKLVERFEHWELIAACGSALRRVVKAISGVERVLAEVEACPSMFTGLYKTEGEEAVLVRSAYVRLVASLTEMEAQRARLGIKRCLRLAGVALATLIGQEIYGALRIEDRRMLRALQQRLITWLRGEQDELDGQRLLGDACALGSLLMQVNRRPELIAHDRQVFELLLAELERPTGDKLDTYERLISLRGRDAELDTLLEQFADLEQWRAPAMRVLASLTPW